MRRYDCKKYEGCLSWAATQGGKLLCEACAKYEKREQRAEEDPFIKEMGWKMEDAVRREECSVEGCTLPARTNGKCKKHYMAEYYQQNREKIDAKKKDNRKNVNVKPKAPPPPPPPPPKLSIDEMLASATPRPKIPNAPVKVESCAAPERAGMDARLLGRAMRIADRIMREQAFRAAMIAAVYEELKSA